MVSRPRTPARKADEDDDREKGLKVEVCAIYLPGKGADASLLVEGVTAAAPDAMGAAIVGDDTTVMSF